MNFDGNVHFVLDEALAAAEIDFDSITTADGWYEAAEKLAAMIVSGSVDVWGMSKSSDAEGNMTFAKLAEGMYLVVQTDGNSDVSGVTVSPMLISVPFADQEQGWMYDVQAYPKSVSNPQKHTQIQVTKRIYNVDENDNVIPLETKEDVFAISELKDFIHFINKNQQQRSRGKDEKRMSVTINKNGRTFIVECIIFQDASFEISINDVTQEEEQVRLKRQLTQNIAHELKTPVSRIQGYLETIVNNENISRDKINTFLERCYAQSNRLSRLLRDISVLTRMDEAANMIDMEKVDISMLVSNIVNEVSLELEQKQITVVNSLKPKIQLRGNYSLLYSIFRNLMDNAIAYAGTNIHINISCFREDENYYYFSFADTGIGVSPEHLNRLFERFYRVDKGRSRKLGGTGLGLAIVKNAVLIHGGTISAKNNQGGGLEFVFTLAKER